MDAQLKISEVAEKINSIETGGGEGKTTVPFKYIEYVEFEGKKYYESPCKLDVDGWRTSKATVKMKEACEIGYSSGITGFSSSMATNGQEFNLTINESSPEFVCFYKPGDYVPSEMPDLIVSVLYNNG